MVLNYKHELRDFFRHGLRSVYCFAFHEKLMDQHALTLSCFKVYSEESSKRSGESSQRIGTGMKGAMQLFAILCETIYRLKNRTSRERNRVGGLEREEEVLAAAAEAEARDRLAGAPRPLFGADPRDDGLAEDNPDEDPDFFDFGAVPDGDFGDGPARRSGRVAVREQQREDDHESDDDDDDEEEEDALEEEEEALWNLLPISRNDRAREQDDADDVMSDEEEGEVDEPMDVDDELDSDKCLVHICRIPENGLILVILTVESEHLTRDLIHKEFESLFESESAMAHGRGDSGGGRGRGRGRRRGRKRKEFRPAPCKLQDIQESYRAWSEEYEFNRREVLYPDEVFTVSNVASVLVKAGYGIDFVKELFCFEDDYAQQPRNQFVRDLAENRVNYVKMPGSCTYTLDLRDFTQAALKRGLLPWLHPTLSNFFSRQFGSSDDAFFSPNFVAMLGIPKNMLAKCADPLDQLAHYVAKIKKEDGSQMLSTERMRETLLILEYVLENVKMAQFYSPSNQALIRFIRQTREDLGGTFTVIGGLMQTAQRRADLGIIDDVPYVPRPDPPVRGDDEDDEEEDVFDDYPDLERPTVPAKIGTLSRFLATVSPMMHEYMTVPKQYMGFVAITPFVLPNAQDRLNGHHFHVTTKGVGQAGKNELYKRITMLIAEGIADSADDFSKHALTTDTPQDGGVIVQNDPRIFLHKDERKLSNRELEDLNLWKELLSSATITYRSQNYVKSDEVGGLPYRQLIKTITPFANCFFWSTNYSSNTGQAMWSRSFHKTVFLAKKGAILGRMEKQKNLGAEERSCREMKATYRQLTTIQMIVMMAISVGILEEVSIGFAVSIMRLVLDEMAAEGLEYCHFPRHFERVEMVMTQLSITRALIKKYLEIDDPVEFLYEDLIDLEPELHATKEVLLISSSFLSEQWIDPVRTSAIITLIRNYYEMDVSEFQLSLEDCVEVDRIVNDSIVRMRNSVGEREPPTGVDMAALFDDRESASEPAPKSRRTNSGFFQRSPGSGDESDGVGDLVVAPMQVRRPMKRRRSGPPRRSRGRSRRIRRRRAPIPADGSVRRPAADQGRDERMRRKLLSLKKDENTQRLKRKGYERGIRRLDRILWEVFLREDSADSGDPGADMRVIEFPRSRDGKQVDLNYICINTPDRRPRIKKRVYYGMQQRPNSDDVYRLLEDIQDPKHYVPVHFDYITRDNYNAIRKVYVEDIHKADLMSDDEQDDADGDSHVNLMFNRRSAMTRRLRYLRSVMSGKHKSVDSISLLSIKTEDVFVNTRTKVKRTTIAFHISLLGRTDPLLIANAVKSQLETRFTVPMRVLCPTPLTEMSQKMGEFGDMRFIDFVPDLNKREGVYANAAFVDEKVSKTYLRAKEDYERRKAAILARALGGANEPVMVSPSARRRSMVNPVDEVLVIKEDIDEYIQRKRMVLIDQKRS